MAEESVNSTLARKNFLVGCAYIHIIYTHFNNYIKGIGCGEETIFMVYTMFKGLEEKF